MNAFKPVFCFLYTHEQQTHKVSYNFETLNLIPTLLSIINSSYLCSEVGLPKGFGPPAGAPGLPMDIFSQQQMAMGMGGMMGQMPVGGMYNLDNMEDYLSMQMMQNNPYAGLMGQTLTKTHNTKAKPVFPANKGKGRGKKKLASAHL